MVLQWSTFCEAVDRNDNAITQAKGRWASPPLVADSWQLATGSISCPSPTYCLAVDGSGKAFEQIGGTWAAP